MPFHLSLVCQVMIVTLSTHGSVWGCRRAETPHAKLPRPAGTPRYITALGGAGWSGDPALLSGYFTRIQPINTNTRRLM